ncbi:xanthine dehydrogenase family protein molybdopterin-binding subunit [Sinomicrobium weinanense]|uniref:Xanthine dehydrogenase family protein molybdopterin-binding subunit n=1 Tax=Sinomicrobium weinanense TaxID=2842200 RepID=A0A926JWI7_9FLAO|nr:molybdopterin cofactor-binding domain-containing protein [Sinomicrobium weinanense]MBC9798661.1 xanthine dehydrogenase family protein molybdopterin-binding subunit [Sinomicrobium weinanense]MBU3122511.1 molybdopterin-dependent oxidoreductase [Sinomicrobium weinanense]
MTIIKTTYNRRSFLKSTALAGGGMMLGFSWFVSCKPSPEQVSNMPREWFEINGFLKIGENGMVTIMSPNPEIGQNVKTSMPMIVAEELDADWKKVIVEQAPLNTSIFTRQLAGGSQSIRQGWDGLRMAGATARQMLVAAAARAWEVPAEEITTDNGTLHHKNSGKSAGYGEMASAATEIPVPEEVKLKDSKDFKIIGTSRKNVDGKKIVTGKPLYGLDYHKEGMLIAMIAHPPAFGLKLKSVDDAEAKAMPGIKDVLTIKTYKDDYVRSMFDADAFQELVVVVGNTTWEVMNAKKALKLEWEPFKGYEEAFKTYSGDDTFSKKMPGGLENTGVHMEKMDKFPAKQLKVARKDGDPEAAFKKAAKVIERSYTAPFLAHNTMEPMNFFAHVTEDKAELAGPVQTPEFMEQSVAARIGLPLDKIDIQMTRQGGGFGRRLYGHFVVEAAVISQEIKAPVKLIYTREDDMTFGNYRPSYHATYRAALDADNKLIAFHVRAGGIPESPLFANRFPAGAIDNYLAESWEMESNITVGAFRAPRSNFIAGVEQAFLDEVAETMEKDPIDFRLELLKRATSDPVGENNDYDASRYAGVLELVREKSNWKTENNTGVHRGVSAYFCHNSYVANVLEMVMKNNKPEVRKVYCAVDCGIVVNPIAAINLVEGGTVDGIGHAMYSQLTFKDGKPEQRNFDRYRLIRHEEAPKAIEVHFVESDEHPSGLGEPPFPPIMGALANALYKATGQRHYHQPFIAEKPVIG